MGNGQTKPSGVPGAPSRGKPLSSRHKPFADTGKDATTPRAIYDGPRVETYAGGAQNVNAKISVQNRHDQDTSLVRCSGFDRTGQLASLTIAISSFGLQIVSTFIRTDADSSDVDDLFYVQTQRAGPVPEQQHAALVAHMERALEMAPSGEDNLITAAMNAGFIGGPGHHTSGGGYDEHKQSRAAFEKSYESNANGGGGFFANNSGSSCLLTTPSLRTDPWCFRISTSWFLVKSCHAIMPTKTKPAHTTAIRGYTSGTGRRDVLKRVGGDAFSAEKKLGQTFGVLVFCPWSRPCAVCDGAVALAMP